MKYYYANAANQPAGPATLDELRQLLARGEITSATNIIPVGESVWRPLNTVLPSASPESTAAGSVTPPPTSPVPPAAPAAPALKPADVAKIPTVLANMIGGLIGQARALLSIPRLRALFGFCHAFGQILVVIGAALALIYGIVYAIKYDSFQPFLAGLIAVLLLAVLQFVAKRLLDACASIVQSSPTRVGSLAVIESIALLLLLAAVAALVSGIIAAIQFESINPLIPPLLAAAVLLVAAGVALHPSLANVEQAPATAGEEAIGLFSFFAKAALVLQPLVFFGYAAAGTIIVLLAIFGRDAAFSHALLAFVPFPVPTEIAGAGLIAAGCLFPVFAYISFLVYYLLIDVLRAILSIPGKLDQLRR